MSDQENYQIQGKLNIVFQQQIKLQHVSKEERQNTNYQQQYRRKKSFNEIKNVEIPIFINQTPQVNWFELWSQFKKEPSIDEQNSILEKILKLRQ